MNLDVDVITEQEIYILNRIDIMNKCTLRHSNSRPFYSFKMRFKNEKDCRANAKKCSRLN